MFPLPAFAQTISFFSASFKPSLGFFFTGIFAISGNVLELNRSQKAYSLFCHSMVLSFFVLVHFAAFAGVFSLSFMWQEWLWEHRKLELDEED